MIISISFGTHDGIVLAFLIVLAFTVIGITLVRRKLNLTRFILAFVLAGGDSAWICGDLGSACANGVVFPRERFTEQVTDFFAKHCSV